MQIYRKKVLAYFAIETNPPPPKISLRRPKILARRTMIVGCAMAMSALNKPTENRRMGTF